MVAMSAPNRQFTPFVPRLRGITTLLAAGVWMCAAPAKALDIFFTVDSSYGITTEALAAFEKSIALKPDQAATLSNVSLPTSGGVIFNNDDVATQAFTLAGAYTLGGSLNVQIGGGSGAPGIVTLSGILSGSGGSLVKTGSGTLVLRGANTFDGGVTIKNGTLESAATQTTLGTGTVTMGGSGSNGATFITGQPNANPFVINAPDSNSVVIGANGSGSGFTMSGGALASRGSGMVVGSFGCVS